MSSLVFPTGFLGLQLVQRRTPQWNTQVQESVSGKESRLNKRSSPLMVYELAFDLLRDDLAVSDMRKLVGFYNAMQGSFDTFLYTDPNWNAVTAHSFGTGDGSTKSFQLTATFKDATGYGWPEVIQNLNGSAAIYNNGTLQTVTTQYTISATGVVTYVSAPGAGVALTWTGAWYYRCRFMDDTLDLGEILTKWWALKKLQFRSVRL
jgi:uncharacterized protein (TIGR02217 family)